MPAEEYQSAGRTNHLSGKASCPGHIQTSEKPRVGRWCHAVRRGGTGLKPVARLQSSAWQLFPGSLNAHDWPYLSVGPDPFISESPSSSWTGIPVASPGNRDKSRSRPSARVHPVRPTEQHGRRPPADHSPAL